MASEEILAGHLATSPIFAPETGLTLYPLVPVIVQEDFDGQAFSLLRPASLTHAWLGIHPSNPLSPDHFSCVSPDRSRELVASWLGVRAPNFEMAEKRKAAILRALALTLPRHERKMFSGRHNFGGRCTFARSGVTESFGDPSVPPLMHNATIEPCDQPWLKRLGEKLESADNTDVRHCRALEYFYRAWPLKPNESFPHMFMAMDSILGDPGRATQAIIEAATKHGFLTYPYERLRLLMSLRASVIHGGAPDVHDGGKYQKYYEDYGADPIVDVDNRGAVLACGDLRRPLARTARPPRRYARRYTGFKASLKSEARIRRLAKGIAAIDQVIHRRLNNELPKPYHSVVRRARRS